MTIAAILQNKGSEVVQVGSGETVRSVVTLLAERRIGCVPVMEGGKVIGIFSERDLVRQIAKTGPTVLDAPVSEVMTSPAYTVEPGMSVLTALSLITQRRMRHLPVCEGDRLIGFISIGDLVKYRIDKIEAEASALRDYIQSA
ncbi:CBS domain-containing protein [Rhizorhapis suberifaciens]|uniref:CBS domain-containing protein n=1 Tax=Rhizorhapis suberifaciens TaxID=13656 RepID=A0A840HR87_9SPHN|nr:CBS domain-containing protein [Rhizorhapis suberifaciens]MBB4640622.1 CBS domain-containing protein [Rhizorhapis suberifaciens]